MPSLGGRQADQGPVCGTPVLGTVDLVSIFLIAGSDPVSFLPSSAQGAVGPFLVILSQPGWRDVILGIPWVTPQC